MIAGLDDAGGVPRLLQDGEREVAVGQLVAAVEQVELVEGVVERRRRPLIVVGDRRAQRQHFAGIVEAAHLQLGDLVHRAVGGVGRHGRVRLQRHEGLVGGVGAGGLRDAADDRHAVVLRGERVLQILPGVDVVGSPEPADRLGSVRAGINRVLAGDRDRSAVDLLDPYGRGEAAPHPELDAEVGVVGSVEAVDLLDRVVDERRIERVLARLQLRPGDVQHDLAEAGAVLRQLPDIEDRGRAVVVEADVAHIHEAGLGGLEAVERQAHGQFSPRWGSKTSS